MSVPDRLSRNIGILTQEDIKILRASKVAIVGCGGAGGRAAVTLARLGVGAFNLVDGGAFDEANINRQEGATVHTINLNKAIIVGKIIQSLGLDGDEVKVMPNNASQDNYDEIIDGCDLVIDAADVSVPEVSAELGKRALAKQTKVVTGLEVGWCAQTTCFTPDNTAELVDQYYGLGTADGSGNLLAQVKYMPKYILQETIEAVLSGELAPPAIAPGVDQLSSTIARQAYCALTSNPNLVSAPNILIIDPMAIEAKVIKM